MPVLDVSPNDGDVEPAELVELVELPDALVVEAEPPDAVSMSGIEPDPAPKLDAPGAAGLHAERHSAKGIGVRRTALLYLRAACSERQSLTKRGLRYAFDGDGKPGQTYVEPWPTQTGGLGVAQDRMKRLVVAGYKSKPGELDAWVFAFIGAGYPPAWQQPPVSQGGWDFATGVCEAWGKCTWVGSTTIDGHLAVVVSQRYP